MQQFIAFFETAKSDLLDERIVGKGVPDPHFKVFTP